MDPDESKSKLTHIAYADDAQHNKGRYRGIGLITLNVEDAEHITLRIKQILHGVSIAEFKWNELHSAKTRFAAINILDHIVEKAAKHCLRVDILTWDIDDTRHKIQGRSDNRNLRRMYYFLFKNILSERWPKHCVWKLCVDESSVEPETHLDYLREISDWDTGELIAQVNVEEIRAVKSHLEPIVQVADLFVGMGVYSRGSYEKYARWLNDTPIKTETHSIPHVSARDKERFQVIKHFDEQCKLHRLGVSLRQKSGLYTFNPNQPINFWWYVPQGEFDKAPKW